MERYRASNWYDIPSLRKQARVYAYTFSAVIISCLASFRGLFAKQEGSGVSGGRYVKTPQENDGSYKYELQNKRRKKSIPLDDLTTTLVTTTISSGDYDRASTTSGNRISGNLVFPINGLSEIGDRRRVD